MDRRHFVKSGIAATAVGVTGFRAPSSPDSSAERRYYELRNYELRTDIKPERIRAFTRDALLPALGRAGAGTVGVMSPETGFPSQSLVVVIEYPSIAAVDAVAQALDADAAYTAARRAFEGADDLPFVRYDSQLMRAFSGHPRIEVPRTEAGRPARMFELRTYEARSAAALERKIAMFNEGEIDLFRSIDMTPVFFGENVFGTRLPSLTYMLTFDDMAARMKAWSTFGSHPDWRRMNSDPRFAALGSVSVTNVAFLRPLGFSQLR